MNLRSIRKRARSLMEIWDPESDKGCLEKLRIRMTQWRPSICLNHIYDNRISKTTSVLITNLTVRILLNTKRVFWSFLKGNDVAERLLASDFLTSPSRERLDDIISRFIDATGNLALINVTCGSCAREINIHVSECDEILLKDIPNKHHLSRKHYILHTTLFMDY